VERYNQYFVPCVRILMSIVFLGSALRIWPPKAGQTGHYKRRFSGLIRVGTSVLKPPSSNDLRHWVRVVPSRQAETRPSTSALVDAAEVASVMY